LLRDWHDFYVLVGTASATLVGLMFVAVSIGTAIFNEDHSAGMAAFITPNVTHFAAVLFACLLVAIPTHSWRTLGALLGAGALAGSIYCGGLVVQIIINDRYKLDRIDRLFYALLPLVGYLLGLIAAVLLVMQGRRERQPQLRSNMTGIPKLDHGKSPGYLTGNPGLEFLSTGNVAGQLVRVLTPSTGSRAPGGEG
jgi:hypothetical protein